MVIKPKQITAFFLILLLSATLTGSALAAEPHVFDALYFIIGSVEANSAPGGADGRKVVFYQSYPDVVETTVESGRYVVNIYNNSSIEVNSYNTYYVAVEQAGDGWGGTPESFTLSSDGWMRQDLGLASGAGPGASTEAADDGWITDTEIERVSGDIRLTWTYNGTSEFADIWRISGEAGYAFTSNEAAYSPIASNVSGTNFTDPDLDVGDGRNAYYRVVPTGVPQDDIFSEQSGTAYNKRTVGKVDISCEARYNLICNPFNTDYIDLPTLFGDQIQVNDIVLWWNQPAQGYTSSSYTAGGWESNHNFEFGDAIFFFLNPDPSDRAIYLTLVGIVGNFASNITKPIGTKYNFIGYPAPVIRNLNEAGLSPVVNDIVLKWDASTQNYQSSSLTAGGWENTSITTFEVGLGKFYYRDAPNGSYNWNFNY